MWPLVIVNGNIPAVIRSDRSENARAVLPFPLILIILVIRVACHRVHLAAPFVDLAAALITCPAAVETLTFCCGSADDRHGLSASGAFHAVDVYAGPCFMHRSDDHRGGADSDCDQDR